MAQQNLEFSMIKEQMLANLKVHNNPYDAMHKAHAVAILTEWDEFVSYNWQTVYDNMQKPAFLFDGRNIVDRNEMADIGFEVKTIGRPLSASHFGVTGARGKVL